MKTKLFTAATIIALAMAVPAMATEMTNGLVKKIDAKLMKVTIKHEELKNLGMPAMTMVFAKGEKVDITKLKEGQKVQFIADRVNGQLTVVEVK